MPVLDRLSALQRHCLTALEVDCFEWRPASGAARATADPSSPPASVATGGEVLLLVAEAAECSAPLVRALARALGAQVQSATAARPVGAVLVSIAQAAPDAALVLPSLDSLRVNPRLKQRSWPRIRGFLRSRREARRP